MYLVVNTGDLRECPPDQPTLCPPDAGKVAFNTNVAISPEGKLVAKYYKHFLFGDKKTQPAPAMLNNKAGYGDKGDFIAHFDKGVVHFGMAICNDINGASTMLGYVAQGISDIIVNANWINSYEAQSISTISNGLSFTHDINVLVSSAGDRAGGSGIFSHGTTVGKLPMSIMDVSKPAYHCIDEQSGTLLEVDKCSNLALIRDVTTTPKATAHESRPLSPASSGVTLGTDCTDCGPRSQPAVPPPFVLEQPSSVAATWPNGTITRPGFALVIPELVVAMQGVVDLGPGTVYKDIKDPVAKVQMGILGNVGSVTLLKGGSSNLVAGNTYSFSTTSADGAVKCEVRATVKASAAEGTEEMFKLSAINSDIYAAPNVPCPMMWNMCGLSRCINKMGTDQVMCTAGPTSMAPHPSQPDAYTDFSSITMKMTTATASIVSPLVANMQLQPLNSSQMTYEGPWKDVTGGKAGDVYSLTLDESTWAPGGFGYASIIGNARLDDEEEHLKKCYQCVNPFNFTDTSTAVLTSEAPGLAPVRASMCTAHFFGSAGPSGAR